MKTPEEIKKGLYECAYKHGTCPICPYKRPSPTNFVTCERELKEEALAYIHQLESSLAQAERERDAAVECIKNVLKAINKHVSRTVDLKNNIMDARRVVLDWAENRRSVCEENTKEENQ